jgi:hypothetical protein
MSSTSIIPPGGMPPIPPHWREESDWIVLIEFPRQDDAKNRAHETKAIGYMFAYSQMTNTRACWRWLAIRKRMPTNCCSHSRLRSTELSSSACCNRMMQRLKPTPGIVDEYFNGSTGDGSEGDSDMRGPWTSSFGLHPVESELNGGKGLSVGDIDGKIDGEDRGKQDDAQKATTSAADEAIGFNASAKKATSTAKRGAKRQAS